VSTCDARLEAGVAVDLKTQAVGGGATVERENVGWLLAELDAVLRPALVEDALGRGSPDVSASVAALWTRLAETLPPPRQARSLNAAARRAIDFTLAFVLIVLTAPLILVLAVLVRLDDGGPALFGHERLTRGGRRFRCWKLRTMRGVFDAAFEDPAHLAAYVANDFKIRAQDDERITPIGRFLRATFLDEVPQLWNVLRGEMALVGPRPIVAREVRWYGPLANELLSVRPGLTGAWQLTDGLGYPHRSWLELAYVRTRSLPLDVQILLRTLLTVVTRRSWPLEHLAPPPSAPSGELVFTAAEHAAAADA
jgi:exopolysaccharide production protein ExoY